ncbi:MAG TPA: hypothetical protein VHQ64_18290, partial [Pyrinomonadaceae bacterium]|nr:hypothetical protein [Pyrinomonadaceae bacterium]
TINRRDAAAHAISDSDGHYVIAGLPAGQYQVWSITPGMIADTADAQNYYAYFGISKSVNLDSGEQLANIDLRLIRGAVITGRLTNPDNKPVVGEAITLQSVDQNGRPRAVFGSSYDEMYQTDDRGVYRIFGVAPGRYRVSAGTDAEGSGFRRARRYDKAFYLDPTDQSKPGIVELSSGEVVDNIDIRVQAAPPTYAIAGRVIDAETGAPVAKSGVMFTPVSKDGRARPGLGLHADDRGEFSWSGFSPGRYRIAATAEFSGGNYYSDPIEFEVVDKDVTDIEVKATPGLTLSGVVSAEGMSPKELATMLPALTVTVSITTPNNPQRGNVGQGIVAADGSFQVAGLRPGKMLLTVSVQRPPFIQTPVSRIEHDGVVITNQNFNLQQSMSGLRVLIDYGTGVLRGVIKVDGDQTVDFSHIRLTCRREGDRYGADAQVDARGHFMFSNLASGPYEVIIEPVLSSNNPERLFPPQKQIVNMTNGQETEVTFTIDPRRKP